MPQNEPFQFSRFFVVLYSKGWQLKICEKIQTIQLFPQHAFKRENFSFFSKKTISEWPKLFNIIQVFDFFAAFPKNFEQFRERHFFKTSPTTTPGIQESFFRKWKLKLVKVGLKNTPISENDLKRPHFRQIRDDFSYFTVIPCWIKLPTSQMVRTKSQKFRSFFFIDQILLNWTTIECFSKLEST